MVQIYILCLVREGHVRVTVGAKAGLAWPMLDYSNKADVDFSTKVLDALGEIQKVAKPENWDVLRPYTFINRNARGRLQPASTNDLVECLTSASVMYRRFNESAISAVVASSPVVTNPFES